MAFDDHVRRGHPIVFGLIIGFAIIELSISAWLTARFNQHHNYPSTSVRDKTRYLLFASIWTIFFSLFYFVLFLHSPSSSVMTSVASHLIFLFVTWVFWLAGAAAITAALSGGLDCGHPGVVYCGQQNALEAFAWIEWILVFFALVFVIFRGVSAQRRGDGIRGGLISSA
ncbi:hypothetical protein C8Q75DRAFT_765639 [Abortiporus biennis]|nr:hypothetical protein C8Q75DRAFT_765639 [Abortiporus biennis]